MGNHYNLYYILMVIKCEVAERIQTFHVTPYLSIRLHTNTHMHERERERERERWGGGGA